MKLCENCQSGHDGSYGSGRFCSLTCSRSFSTKAKRNEINKSVSDKLKLSGHKPVNKKCKQCKNKFQVKWAKRKQECCSKSCSIKMKWEDEAYQKHISDCSRRYAIKKHKSGDNFGWSTRKKLQPSYPEKIAIRVLDKLNIKYEREFKLGKYFIDFVIHEHKIAIEIDGRQHEIKERKIVDNRKDKILISNGWTVYRISYPKENIRERLNEILSVSSIGRALV
jgi:very-short-patch-repair endonuclease